jgi:hypothetical protein
MKSDVDREIRIEKMKRGLEELSGAFGEVSPELDEIFLERVLRLRRSVVFYMTQII